MRGKNSLIWGLIFGVALLPWLANPFFQLPDYALQNFTDSAFYPAYSVNFSELILRYGWMYYATRFGVILPDAVAAWVFGAPQGWLILRSSLQSALLVLIFLFFRQVAGTSVGLVAVFLWWTSPVALRFLCTTYLDSLSVVFLVGGILLLAWPGFSWGRSLSAGVLLGLSMSAHLYLWILLAILVPWLAGIRWKEKLSLLKSSVAAIGTAASVWIAAWAYYRTQWGLVDFLAPTWELMSKMADGDTELWRSPLLTALQSTPAWLVLPGIAGMMLLLLRMGSPALWGAWFSLSATAGLFWLGDLVGGAYAMSMPFYYSFAFPVVFLSACTVFSETLLHCCSSQNRADLLLPAAAIIFLVATASVLTRIVTPWIEITAVVSLAVLYLTGSIWYAQRAGLSRAAVGISGGILVAAHFAGLFSPFFAEFLGEYKRLHRSDLWQPKLGVKLSELLPPAALDGRVAAFWYADEEPTYLRMVQAAQLHATSMPRNLPEGTEFPHLSQEGYHALRAQGIELLVLLSPRKSEILTAIQSFQQKDERWVVERKGEFQSMGRAVNFAVVTLESSNEPAADKTAADWRPLASSRFYHAPDGKFLLVSSARRWLFEAECPLPSGGLPGEVEVRAQLHSGRLLFSVLDINDRTIASAEVWPTGLPTRRRFLVPAHQGNLRVVARNMMPDGSTSTVTLDTTTFRPITDRSLASPNPATSP